MIRGWRAAVRTGLLDLRGDLRRFVLLLTCLAVGTALISGVNSVGASIAQAVERNAAELMGGDLELSRADRPASPVELEIMAAHGAIATVVDTNVRGQANGRDAFIDLAAIGETYPLLGTVASPDLPPATSAFLFLAPQKGTPGALVAPLLLDPLGIAVGDQVELGGTTFDVRGTLGKLPDGLVRGFRLGLTTLITADGLGLLSDRTSPLPGLGNWFRYKILLDGENVEGARAQLEETLGTAGWTVRSARDGLGPMVRYYDIFMRFLLVVGLGSLLIGGVAVWTGMRAYISERSSVIAVLRSLGAEQGRIFLHFFAQVAALAAIGVGAGLLIGGGSAYFILPAVGEAVGVALAPAVHAGPLLVAAGAGLLTAFAFAYLPLQQAQTIRPALLFRSKGLAAPPIDWLSVLASWQVLPLLVIVVAFFGLAVAMTGDAMLVAAFAAAAAVSALAFQLVIWGAQLAIRRLPEPPNRIVRHAVRAIAATGSNAPATVVAVGMALTMLVVVLVLQGNMRQEFLGASAFDVPTFVAADLFPDEIDTLVALDDSNLESVVATPMLRGALTAVNGTPVSALQTRGPEATFLLSGEVPLTFRTQLPASSRLIAGDWWPADYGGPGLVSLHHSLRNGLGVDLGDTLTFAIFGEPVTVQVANFRDYSWQGGIDFLATFSPGVIEQYPTTLFASANAVAGREEAAERSLAAALPDVRFIAIGDTLKQITAALGQLSFAAALVGGLAVGNGLLVLIGSLATGRRQREADTVITKVLGATRLELLATAFVQYLALAAIAALPSAVLGIGLGWLLTQVMLQVGFTAPLDVLALVLIGAAVITAALGAATILRAASARPARLLRDL